MTVSLDEVKLYLRVDNNEEDELITSFIFTIEELCEGILRRPLTEFAIVPETIKQAILYGVGCLYEQREIADIKAILVFLKSVLFSYRQEEW